MRVLLSMEKAINKAIEYLDSYTIDDVDAKIRNGNDIICIKNKRRYRTKRYF